MFKRSAVILETFDRGQGAPYSAKGVEIWWTIDSILIPSALKDHKAEIMELIKESLAAMDKNPDYPVRTRFKRVARPEVVKEGKP